MPPSQLSGTNYVSTMLLVVGNFRLKFTRSLNFGMGSGRETSGINFDLGNLQPNKWEKTKALKLLIQCMVQTPEGYHSRDTGNVHVIFFFPPLIGLWVSRQYGGVKFCEMWDHLHPLDFSVTYSSPTVYPCQVHLEYKSLQKGWMRGV